MKFGLGPFSMQAPLGSHKTHAELYREMREQAVVTFDSHCERFLIGDPDRCIREIAKYQRELGMDYLICWMHYPGAAHQKTPRAMRLFAKKVMPHFRK
jgi:alkanesulfonate monooxygenase SsuD/methylene tetrahydromethanopterin reductase-like flavin-dependent oxidoreductase (luciferase family)